MWHLGGLWGCWWEQKAPSGNHWARTGRHVARAHLYVEMPVSRLDMELSPSILEVTSRDLVQSKADIELRSNHQKTVFVTKSHIAGFFFWVAEMSAGLLVPSGRPPPPGVPGARCRPSPIWGGDARVLSDNFNTQPCTRCLLYTSPSPRDS